MNIQKAKKYTVLSIEALAGMEQGSWDWNAWYRVGELELTPSELDNPIEKLIEEGFLKDSARELADLEDDGHNVVILDKETREPVFAIEYGNNF
jgi:hypothetical protein